MTNGESRFAHIQNQARLYTLEGMLARIAASVYADDFVLKGGVLLASQGDFGNSYSCVRRHADFCAGQVGPAA